MPSRRSFQAASSGSLCTETQLTKSRESRNIGTDTTRLSLLDTSGVASSPPRCARPPVGRLCRPGACREGIATPAWTNPGAAKEGGFLGIGGERVRRGRAGVSRRAQGHPEGLGARIRTEPSGASHESARRERTPGIPNGHVGPRPTAACGSSRKYFVQSAKLKLDPNAVAFLHSSMGIA